MGKPHREQVQRVSIHMDTEYVSVTIRSSLQRMAGWNARQIAWRQEKMPLIKSVIFISELNTDIMFGERRC